MTPSSVRIQIDGNDIHNLSADCILVVMEIEHEANQHSRCSLEYRQTPDRPFDLTKYHDAQLQVFAVVDGGEFEIFNGWVQQCKQRYEAWGTHHLTLEGAGFTIDLDQQNRHKTYSEWLTFSSRMKEILTNSMLEPQVAMSDDPPMQREYQLGETDWVFLQAQVAEAGGMLVSDSMKLWAMDKFASSGLTLDWRNEGGLISFEVESEYIPSKRRGVNYDREEAKSKIWKDVADDVPRLGAVADLCNRVKECNQSAQVQGANDAITMDAEAIAEECLKADSQAAFAQAVRGRGESRDAQLLVGRSIEISGNTQFAGKWGVTKVTHKWENAGYLNEFECTPFDTAVCVPTLEIPRVHSHFRGRIVSVPNAKTGRIKVQFPWEESDSISVFWPWLAPNAGDDRGICFPPEIGDEVLVAFHNGDANHAYILGTAWNGKELPPLEDLHGSEVDDNDIKRIVTKSGNRLVMDDKKGKETMVMATPKHVRVSLFDGGKTLLLHSDGDVHIHAGGTVHMKCKQFLREVG